MKGRENVKKAPSTDLLVCFPSRAHLALLPKPICSPARAIESGKHHRRLMKSRTRGGGGGGGGSSGGGGMVASPLLWAKNKQMSAPGLENAEPTSPKVTCAGQIKVRHKGGGAACKSWQSVMEEIERIHRKNKKKSSSSSWVDSFGFKKEVMQFLTCLRNIKFDFRCFGSIPQSDITSDDDEEEEEEELEEEDHGGAEGSDGSRAVFSKWFMVLQENQNDDKEKEKEKEKSFSDHHESAPPSVPPANALLLMRCRSAPVKSWLEEKEEEEAVQEQEQEEEKKKGTNLRALMEEETRNSKNKDLERIVMMKYDTDFYKISSDIAKETWVNVGGGIRDPLSRSRSWKR